MTRSSTPGPRSSREVAPCLYGRHFGLPPSPSRRTGRNGPERPPEFFSSSRLSWTIFFSRKLDPVPCFCAIHPGFFCACGSFFFQTRQLFCGVAAAGSFLEEADVQRISCLLMCCKELNYYFPPSRSGRVFFFCFSLPGALSLSLSGERESGGRREWREGGRGDRLRSRPCYRSTATCTAFSYEGLVCPSDHFRHFLRGLPKSPKNASCEVFVRRWIFDWNLPGGFCTFCRVGPCYAYIYLFPADLALHLRSGGSGPSHRVPPLQGLPPIGSPAVGRC